MPIKCHRNHCGMPFRTKKKQVKNYVKKKINQEAATFTEEKCLRYFEVSPEKLINPLENHKFISGSKCFSGIHTP